MKSDDPRHNWKVLSDTIGFNNENVPVSERVYNFLFFS